MALICVQCGLQYVRQSALDKHVDTIHGPAPYTVPPTIELAEKSGVFKNRRPCATGCGFDVAEKDVTYGVGSRAQTYRVLIHVGFTLADYPKIERCAAS
jgi:hypothetical protein